MTRKRKKGSPPKSKKRTEESDAPARRHTEIRPYIYAGFDALTVVVWTVLLTSVLPNRHGWAASVLWLMVGLVAVMGACMFVRSKWGWRVGAAACAVLIAMWIGLVVVLLMTAGFLSGVYGGFGQAAALAVLGMAFISLQAIALLPAFQLKFLMTRAGRRYFGLEPVWQ